jgi:DNA repair photolyase
MVRHDRRLVEPCALEGFTYQVDPYVGCQHRCLYCYTQNDCPVDWDREIGFVPEFVARLSEELSQIEPQTIYMGMNTDPYQPAEAKYATTRKILDELRKHGFSACILTKSDYVVRDLNILRQMPDASVGVSIAFQDESIRKLFEANTIPMIDRIRVLGRFKSQGIPTYALICPVFPLITDVEVLIKEVRSCAWTIWIYRLEMESENDRNWQRILPILRAHFPDVADEVRSIVFSPEHAYWQELRRSLQVLQAEKNLNLEIRI